MFGWSYPIQITAGIVIFFQITLCLVVHCYGISIVWCAMAGWIISERKRIKDDIGLEPRATDQATPSSTASSCHDNDSGVNNADPQNNDQQHETGITRMALLVILLDIGTIVNYVVVSALITTVAHICAMVLGAILSELSQRMSQVFTSEGDNVSTAAVPGNTDPLLPAGRSATTVYPPPGLFVKYGLSCV